MTYLTIARIAGDPERLLDGYRQTSEVMSEVGRDHGLIVHAAAQTDEGLLIVNLWPSRDGSEAAAGDPRRGDVVRRHGLDPGQMRYEHHDVAHYDLFDQPEAARVGTDELTFRATSEQTGGALLAVEVTMPPGGGPPMLHRHAAAEIYRVERGELAIYLEDDEGRPARVGAGPGAVVPIPGGRAHTVRNESRDEARAYVVFAPGAEIERFMRAAGALAADGAAGPADILALAERHGIEMTRPVPTGAPEASLPLA